MTRRAEIERMARFMGWEKNGPCIQAFQDEPYYEFNRGTKAKPCWKPFDPFTRLDDAMAVAEKMIADGIFFSGGFLWDTINGQWQFLFRGHGELLPLEGVGHESLPTAITLAALAYLSAAEGK